MYVICYVNEGASSSTYVPCHWSLVSQANSDRTPRYVVNLSVSRLTPLSLGRLAQLERPHRERRQGGPVSLPL